MLSALHIFQHGCAWVMLHCPWRALATAEVAMKASRSPLWFQPSPPVTFGGCRDFHVMACLGLCPKQTFMCQVPVSTCSAMTHVAISQIHKKLPNGFLESLSFRRSWAVCGAPPPNFSVSLFYSRLKFSFYFDSIRVFSTVITSWRLK